MRADRIAVIHCVIASALLAGVGVWASSFSAEGRRYLPALIGGILWISVFSASRTAYAAGRSEAGAKSST